MTGRNPPDPDGQNASHWRKLWELLDHQERITAAKVLSVAILAAIASTFMVGSIMPFLSVLADPAQIQKVPRLAWAYQHFGFTSPYSFLLALGLGSLIVIVIAIGLQLLNIYVSSRFAVMRVHSLSRKLLAGYLDQPYEHFLNRHSGEMTTRVLAESQEVVTRFLLPSTDLLTSSLTIFSLIGLLIWVNPVITLAAFGLLGATYGITYVFSRKRLNRYGRIRVARNTERYRITSEAFGGIKEIKLLGREGVYVDRYSRPVLEMADSMVKTQIISQTPYYTIQAVALGGVILLCLVLVGPISATGKSVLPTILPLLGVFAFAGQRMMPELGKFYQAIAKIQSARGAVDLIHHDLMAANARSGAAPKPGPRLHLRRELVFDNVTYRYPQTDIGGVTDISFTMHHGEKIGIVGGTGAGKTTLADIVLGLLRPQSGSISADGTAIEDRNVRSWQQSVGYVPQDIFLSDASIFENIAFGVPPDKIDRDRVEAAARAAQIDGFIRSDLPEGYDTFVGERGVRLSGGQRQRIGIARALFHDAELIVFDEATSALDNHTEAEVISAIDGLPGDKTVLMIAHRLSTVECCDRIIVMDRGRIVGCDRWEELIAHNATFQRIARMANSA